MTRPTPKRKLGQKVAPVTQTPMVADEVLTQQLGRKCEEHRCKLEDFSKGTKI